MSALASTAWDFACGRHATWTAAGLLLLHGVSEGMVVGLNVGHDFSCNNGGGGGGGGVRLRGGGGGGGAWNTRAPLLGGGALEACVVCVSERPRARVRVRVCAVEGLR